MPWMEVLAFHLDNINWRHPNVLPVMCSNLCFFFPTQTLYVNVSPGNFQLFVPSHVF